MRLVADIGGTNSRIALSDAGGIVQPESLRSFANADWPGFDALLAHYIASTAWPDPRDAVLAVAGPVHGSTARLTNRNWHFDTHRLSVICGGAPVSLLNDLQALGHATAWLAPDGQTPLRAAVKQHAAPTQKLVVGIGTGFNVCPVTTTARITVCGAAEAGHMSLPSPVMQQLDRLTAGTTPFVTVEDLFSGRGLGLFCSLMSGQTVSAQAVIAAYRRSDVQTAAVDAYAALLGGMLRELAFAYLPTGGIYLAGSVARAVLQTAPEPCFAAFEQPFMEEDMTDFSVCLITDDAAALTGCARL